MSRTELLLSISGVRQTLRKISLDLEKRGLILSKIDELEMTVRNTDFGL